MKKKSRGNLINAVFSRAIYFAHGKSSIFDKLCDGQTNVIVCFQMQIILSVNSHGRTKYILHEKTDKFSGQSRLFRIDIRKR